MIFITVISSVIEAQLVETTILTQINHKSLIATKTRRIVSASDGRIVAVYGTRASYIGGASSTSNVMVEKQFEMPISGIRAHSWIMFYNNEYEAFKHSRYESV